MSQLTISALALLIGTASQLTPGAAMQFFAPSQLTQAPIASFTLAHDQSSHEKKKAKKKEDTFSRKKKTPSGHTH